MGGSGGVGWGRVGGIGWGVGVLFIYLFIYYYIYGIRQLVSILFSLLRNFHFILVHSYLFYVLTNYKENIINQLINQSHSLASLPSLPP